MALGILVISSLLMLVGNILSDIIYASSTRASASNDAADRPTRPNAAPLPAPDRNPFSQRLRKFRRLKRGY